MKIILNTNRPAHLRAVIDDLDLNTGIEFLQAEMDQRELALRNGQEKVTTSKFEVIIEEEELLARKSELDALSARMLKQNNQMYVLVPKVKKTEG